MWLLKGWQGGHHSLKGEEIGEVVVLARPDIGSVTSCPIWEGQCRQSGGELMCSCEEWFPQMLEQQILRGHRGK